MSTHLTRIVEAFNAGRLDDVVAQTTEDYQYSDPSFGRVDGAAAHRALTREILDRFPDRKMEVLRSWTTPDAEFAECRWIGTRTEDGEIVTLHFATIIELNGGLVRRWDRPTQVTSRMSTRRCS
jgi:limonene-1,2-epoxide hydrolase